MGSLRALVIASAVALAAAGGAKAADLLPPAPQMEPAPVQFSGWYLRGDIGVGVNMGTPKLTDTPNPLVGLPADASDTFFNPSISGSGMFDIGVGYQFNSWLRFDLTGEYRGFGQFHALEGVAIPSASTQYADWYHGNLSSFILMANGYIDFGTWNCLTPFVGAGIGWAQNHLDGVTDTGFAYVGPGSPGSPTGGFFNNGTTENFAWALMAGLDFDLSQNLKLELSYRYLDYGIAKTGGSNCFDGQGHINTGNCGGGSHFISTDHLASSDFRIGLRWLFSDVPAPQPVMTRY